MSWGAWGGWVFLGLLALGPPFMIGVSELVSWVRRRRARRRRWFNGR